MVEPGRDLLVRIAVGLQPTLDVIKEPLQFARDSPSFASHGLLGESILALPSPRAPEHPLMNLPQSALVEQCSPNLGATPGPRYAFEKVERFELVQFSLRAQSRNEAFASSGANGVALSGSLGSKPIDPNLVDRRELPPPQGSSERRVRLKPIDLREPSNGLSS